MAQGLQVWDAGGNLVVDITSRLTKWVGSVTISSDGSQTISNITGNEVWATFIPSGLPSLTTNNFPRLSISGNVLSWSYASTTNRVSGTILYGVY